MMPVAMVGRGEQLREISRSWEAVTAGPGAGVRSVVVTGPAGVGKSRLVSAALDSFTPRPYNVLRGTARVHGPAPYDWLAAVLSGTGTDGLPAPPDALAWLAQHPDAPRERFAPEALLRLAVRVVRALVGVGPSVLVVEDLHALDPASVILVAELATVSALPALLLVTSQPPETSAMPELAGRALARLTGVPGAVRQHLGPLDLDQVAAVLAEAYPRAPVPPEVARAAHRGSGGNPYRLVELLAAGGPDPAALLAPAAVPPAGPAPARARRPEGELTAREVEVLGCLAAGMSNKQVARSLGISVRTVTVHVSNLLRKTRSASRTEAALWAVRHMLAVPRGTR